MRAAILGLGEAGQVFSKALAAHGWDVYGFDPADVATPESITRAQSIASAVRGADLVLSLTTAKFAVSAAAEAGPELAPQVLYIDLNAASPTVKRTVAETIGSRANVVDAAVLGSVMKFGPAVELLLAGPQADEAARFLAEIGATPEVVGAEIGAASERKLLRSVFVKSLAALIAETMDAGRASGHEEWLRTEMARWLSDGDTTIERLDHTTRLHALRRSLEVQDSLTVLSELGVTSSLARGALEAHLRYARETKTLADPERSIGPTGVADSSAPGESLAVALARIPTPALGDANDRRGLLHSMIHPVWGSPRIAGRAFTIETRPGDNKAIHDAIPKIQPGDVVVIDGGGHTERALIGELIAERFQGAGAVGVVIDGAVRDPRGCEDLGFPVWSRAITPAGPYRHGPGRSQVTISVGGVVCSHGDFVVADEDGVMIVPALEAESLAFRGEAKLAAEEQQRIAHRDSRRPR